MQELDITLFPIKTKEEAKALETMLYDYIKSNHMFSEYTLFTNIRKDEPDGY